MVCDPGRTLTAVLFLPAALLGNTLQLVQVHQASYTIFTARYALILQFFTDARSAHDAITIDM